MYRPYAGDGPEPIGVLLIPKFAAMAFFSAIEPLRVANRMAGRELFAWRSLSIDGGPVEASNGMRFMADGALAEAAAMPTLIVCSSFDPQLNESRQLLSALRRLSRAGVMLGALDTGAHILAKAGLLANETVTMHWEAVPGFREEFPEIEVSEELFEVGRGCFTCAGGTAALDMMLGMIGRKHGPALARAVSEQFIHDRIRSSSDHQRMERGVRLQITNRKALKIIDLMERNLEQPLDGPALAAAARSRAQLAAPDRSAGDRDRAGHRLRLGRSAVAPLPRAFRPGPARRPARPPAGAGCAWRDRRLALDSSELSGSSLMHRGKALHRQEAR